MRTPLATSKLTLTDPPPPALLVVWKAGVVVGLETLLVISTPATSKWNLLLGSKANFAMMSGCKAAALIWLLPLLICTPIRFEAPDRAAGTVTALPPFPPPM